MKKTYQLSFIALMAAVMCILGPLSITLPFSPVPISLTNLAIFLAVYALGTWRATASYLVYLGIGIAGLPVFSAFSGGPGKLLGPTGGYLIGFLFTSMICGLFLDRLKNRFAVFAGFLLGMAFAYFFGSIWLACQLNLTLPAALLAGVVPFLPGDLLKIIFAMATGPQIRKALQKAGLFPAGKPYAKPAH